MIRLLASLPFLLVIVLFALSNRQTVALGLWPLAETVALPLSLAILLLMGIGVLIGALVAWIGGLRHWRRARLAEHRAALLQARLDGLAPIATEPGTQVVTIDH